MSTVRVPLGWGAALVALGLVLLLRSLETVPASTAAWPWAVLAAGGVLLLHPGARRGGSLAVPLVLLVVGGVFALRELAEPAVRIPLIPLVLVAVGVVLLTTALREPAARAAEELAVPLDGATEARIVLAHGAGRLRVTGGADDGALCQGVCTGGVHVETQRVGDRLEVTLRPPRDLDRLLREHRPLDWQLRLPARLPVALEVRTGASEAHLDLLDTVVGSLAVKVGASDLSVVVPATGRSRVDIDAGAADVDVRVPDRVAAAVRVSSALASVDVDAHRFPRDGEGYRSPGYDDADDRVEIDLEGGVAAFAVR